MNKKKKKKEKKRKDEKKRRLPVSVADGASCGPGSRSIVSAGPCVRRLMGRRDDDGGGGVYSRVRR